MGRTGQALGWATLTGSGVTLPHLLVWHCSRGPSQTSGYVPERQPLHPGVPELCSHTEASPPDPLRSQVMAARAAPGFPSSLILPDHGRPVLDPGSEKCDCWEP